MPTMSAEVRVLDLACSRLRAPACVTPVPHERRGGEGCDVLGDQEPTPPPATGGARCMRMVPATKRRCVQAFLPHGAWVHTAAEGLLVLSLHRLEASPSGIG